MPQSRRPGYWRGRSAVNKGKTFPAEILTAGEMRALLQAFDSSPTDVRNKAMVMLMYRAELKKAQVIALERRHYERGSQRLVLPAWKTRAERAVTLDAETASSLDQWMETRRLSRVRVTAPLFCALLTGSKGNRMSSSYFHDFLAKKASLVGIDRRVSTEGLRRSGQAHRALSHGRVGQQLGVYVDEAVFQSNYPDAFEQWELALGLFNVNAVSNARRIGEDCRAAMASFVNAALSSRDVEVQDGSGTVTKLRALIRAVGPRSRAVAAHHDALVRYWGTVSDLDQRLAHEAAREGETLTADDSRRAILYTLLVMVEVDRALAG